MPSARRTRDELSRGVKDGMGNALGIAQFGGVLHAFQKKSASAIRTATKDVDLIARWLEAAQRVYEEHHGKSKR